ncbi:unnamed protein product [Colias eurytheme]|nr:unnamed protein product [Colias eurytheme]
MAATFLTRANGRRILLYNGHVYTVHFNKKHSDGTVKTSSIRNVQEGTIADPLEQLHILRQPFISEVQMAMFNPPMVWVQRRSHHHERLHHACDRQTHTPAKQSEELR